MKFKLSLLFIFICTLVFAQDINQNDSDGLRHGIWRKNFEGTKAVRYKGQFKHGKEIGLFKFYKYIDKKSVLSASKQFNDSNDIAEVKFYSSKGQVISKGKMIGKKFVGPWIYFHENSENVMRIEEYDILGLQQGELLVYFENGELAEKSNYLNDNLEGNSFWYNENGIKIKEFTYRNNELHGPSKYYSNSGQLLVEGYYRNGRKHGIWIYYENGKLIKKKDFTRRSKNPYKKK
jgi:antitoxin component YwqK of YwqJK toxin-antitoxin module